MIQEQGDLDDSYHQDAQNDEDQMIISGDSIDRYLKSDLNNEEVNSGTGAVPKMSNLIIAMALQNNFCPCDPYSIQTLNYCYFSVKTNFLLPLLISFNNLAKLKKSLISLVIF